MRPLADIRIVSLEQYGAGPFGSLQLAHLGADVIKVEDPVVRGDSGRYTPTHSAGEDSLFFEARNRNKRSMSLNIRTEEGRAVFHDLVRNADAVYSNLRGDSAGQLRIRYDDLRPTNERIVCCSLTGFGTTGPLAAEPAYDYIIQALAGWMSLTGEPNGPPEKTGLSLVDTSTGLVAALALLAGVHAARRDGRGMDCDISLYDTAISLLGYQATWHMTAGYRPSRHSRSSHPTLVPCQVFEAMDGWLVIMCPKEKFWHRLTDVLGRPDLAGDPKFTSMSVRLKHRTELQDIIDSILLTRPVDDWLDRLRHAGVPSAPVYDLSQALTAQQTIARSMVVHTEHPRYGTVVDVNSPVHVGERRTDHVRAPRRGEHTHQILRELLKYNDETIDNLIASGALGADE